MAELNGLSLLNDAALLGYWRMEGDSTHTTAGPDGTDTVMVYNALYGKYGQGALFVSASTSHIDLGDNLARETGDSLSISFWAQPTTTADKDIVQKKTGSFSQNYTVGVFGTKWSFGYFPENATHNGGTDEVWQSNVVADTTQMTHVVVVYTIGTASTLKMYINNVDVTSGGSWVYGDGNLGRAHDTGTDHLFFSTPSGKNYLGANYGGYLDDVAIFGKLLSVGEVDALYNDSVATYTNGNFFACF